MAGYTSQYKYSPRYVKKLAWNPMACGKINDKSLHEVFTELNAGQTSTYPPGSFTCTLCDDNVCKEGEKLVGCGGASNGTCTYRCPSKKIEYWDLTSKKCIPCDFGNCPKNDGKALVGCTLASPGECKQKCNSSDAQYWQPTREDPTEGECRAGCNGRGDLTGGTSMSTFRTLQTLLVDAGCSASSLRASCARKCDCSSKNFIGDHCECSREDTCSGNGDVHLDFQGECGCTCDSDWVGFKCEHSNKGRCSNQGNVSMDNSGHVHCKCDAGWAGDDCTCSNANTCSGQGTVYTQTDDEGACVCQCDPGLSGKSCEFSDDRDCSGNGRADDNGKCKCDGGFAGEHCKHSDAVACDGAGAVDADGGCTCHNRDVAAGKHCREYSNQITCNGNGQVNDAGHCTCNPGFIDSTQVLDPSLSCGPNAGLRPECSLQCKFSDDTTCTGKGSVNSTGACDCLDPEFGEGETCSEYTNAGQCGGGRWNGVVVDKAGSCKCEPGYAGQRCNHSDAVTCSGKGKATYAGTCECFDPSIGEGKTCSEYTNAVTCHDLGVVNKDGGCRCNDPRTGEGPTCTEYTNTKTCNDLGDVTQYGDCHCFEWAVSIKEDGSNKTKCTTHDNACNKRGTVNSTGVCDCNDGYAGKDCTECDAAYREYEPRTAFKCLLRGSVGKCEDGEYFDASARVRACKLCGKDTFSEDAGDGGFRVACTSCPKLGDGTSQTSAPGSRSTGCHAKYQLAPQALSVDYCTGKGEDERRSTLTGIRNFEDCREAAAGMIGFRFDGKPACADSKAECTQPDATRTQLNLLCNLKMKMEFQGNSNGAVENTSALTLFSDACQHTCNTCKSGQTRSQDAQTGKPVDCVADLKQKVVRFYSGADDQYDDVGYEFTPVCEAFFCPDGKVQATDATRREDPRCRDGRGAVQQAIAAEDDANQNVAVPIIVVFALLGACGAYTHLLLAGRADRPTGENTAKRLPSGSHWFAWFAIGARVADMVSDWAFYTINVRGGAFESVYGDGYADTADANVRLFQDLALAFCVVGFTLTCFDLYGASVRRRFAAPFAPQRKRLAQAVCGWCPAPWPRHQNESGEEEKKPMGAADRKAMFCITLAVTLLEDVPQLTLMGIYIRALQPHVGVDVVTVTSLLLSGFSLLQNLLRLCGAACETCEARASGEAGDRTARSAGGRARGRGRGGADELGAQRPRMTKPRNRNGGRAHETESSAEAERTAMNPAYESVATTVLSAAGIDGDDELAATRPRMSRPRSGSNAAAAATPAGRQADQPRHPTLRTDPRTPASGLSAELVATKPKLSSAAPENHTLRTKPPATAPTSARTPAAKGGAANGVWTSPAWRNESSESDGVPATATETTAPRGHEQAADAPQTQPNNRPGGTAPTARSSRSFAASTSLTCPCLRCRPCSGCLLFGLSLSLSLSLSRPLGLVRASAPVVFEYVNHGGDI